MIDPEDDSWTINGAGLSHSLKYGFGLIDANASVAAAKDWINFGQEQLVSEQSGEIDLKITDNLSETTSSSLNISQDAVVESVVVYLELVHNSRGHLKITLTSPSGTESVLTPGQRPENTQLPESNPWKLMTVVSWGESSVGEWSVNRYIQAGVSLSKM